MRSFTCGFLFAATNVVFLPASAGFAHMLLTVPFLLLLVFLLARRATGILLQSASGALTGTLLTLLVFQQHSSQRVTDDLLGTDQLVTGTVHGIPKRDDTRTSFDLRIRASVPADQPALHRLVRLSWYGNAPLISPGDTWRLRVRLKRPGSLGNPGSFDYARWLFTKGITLTGYVRSPGDAQLLSAHHWSVDYLRSRIGNALATSGSANEYLPLVQGLALGLTHNISDAHWDVLRQSGTAHLLAISGLHIALVAGWSFFLASMLWRYLFFGLQRFNRQLFCTVAMLAGATFYAAMAGFTLPTQRALLMLIAVCLSIVLRRFWPPYTTLLFAMLFVLLHDQMVIATAGFWMSFGAVATLLYLHNGRLSRSFPLLGFARMQLQLGLVLLPVTAWFFQSGSLVAPLANLFAVPLVSVLVIPLSLLTIALQAVSDNLAGHVLQLTQWLLSVLFRGLDALLQLPMASVNLAVPDAQHLVYAIFGLFLLMSPRGLHLRWLAVPSLLPLLLANTTGQRSALLELHVLDVGQGHAAVVLTPNHALLFDTGNKVGRSSDMVERAVKPFLLSKGRSNLDRIVISHADADHAGGLDSAMRHFPAADVVTSETGDFSEFPAQACRAGMEWQWDSVHFAFVHPAGHDTGDRNNLSCVLLVYAGASRILLTGDIEAAAENTLVQRLVSLPVTVLVAPHHGSRTSSTPRFVQALQPEYVVFPAGHGNAFGFPHADVQMRYKISGSNAYSTGEDGAVSFEFDLSGLQRAPQAFWRQRRRFTDR